MNRPAHVLGALLLAAASSAEPSLVVQVSPGGATLAPDAGGAFLVTEALLTNTGDVPLRFLRGLVVVRDGEGGLLRSASVQGNAVEGPLWVLSPPSARGTGVRSLPPGGQALLYTPLLELPDLEGGTLGVTVVATPEGAGAPVVEEVQLPLVRAPRRPRLRFPVRGTWLTLNGPADRSHHRRAASAVDPELRTSQRYALDLIPFDEEAARASGRVLPFPEGADPGRLESYLAYDREVLAMGPGEVVHVEGHHPDQPIGATDAAHPAGNHVVVRHGPALFGTYAHLRPGTLGVEEGARVEAGQVLGRVGNSGNTSMPHLHVHCTAGPAALTDRAVPVAFHGIRIRGRPPYARLRAQLPRDGEVVEAGAPGGR